MQHINRRVPKINTNIKRFLCHLNLASSKEVIVSKDIDRRVERDIVNKQNTDQTKIELVWKNSDCTYGRFVHVKNSFYIF